MVVRITGVVKQVAPKQNALMALGMRRRSAGQVPRQTSALGPVGAAPKGHLSHRRKWLMERANSTRASISDTGSMTYTPFVKSAVGAVEKLKYLPLRRNGHSQ